MSYLAAVNECRQVELYAWDLLWAAVRDRFRDLPMPSEAWNNKHKIDRRSGKQIMEDILKGLGGE